MKTHQSRLSAPKRWPIKRKGIKWIARAIPGPHNKSNAIPLVIVLRDLLKLSETTKDVKKILNSNKVLINNKFSKNHRLPIGLMDIISIPSIKKHFRVIINKKGRIELQEINEGESKEKHYKIQNKRKIKKNKIQLNLHDGTNLLVKEEIYEPGDTIILDLEKNQIKNHIKLKKGALVYLTAGKHAGNIAKFEEIRKSPNKQNKIIVKLDNTKIETKKDYVFVLDKMITK